MDALQWPPQAELLFKTQFLYGCLPLLRQQRLLYAAQFRLLSSLPDRCAGFRAARTAPTNRKITFSAQDCYSAHSLPALAPYSFSIVRCFVCFLLPLLFSAQFFRASLLFAAQFCADGLADSLWYLSSQTVLPFASARTAFGPSLCATFSLSQKKFFLFLSIVIQRTIPKIPVNCAVNNNCCRVLLFPAQFLLSGGSPAKILFSDFRCYSAHNSLQNPLFVVFGGCYPPHIVAFRTKGWLFPAQCTCYSQHNWVVKSSTVQPLYLK